MTDVCTCTTFVGSSFPYLLSLIFFILLLAFSLLHIQLHSAIRALLADNPNSISFDIHESLRHIPYLFKNQIRYLLQSNAHRTTVIPT